MMKKAQAAMEFLMTYGWAILVVLVAIGALAYFGVLSPDNFLPERCTGPAGLDCLDKATISADANSVTFVLKNNIGFKTSQLTVTNADGDCTGFSAASPGTIMTENSSGQYEVKSAADNNRKIWINVSCGTGAVNTGRFKTNVNIFYVNNQTGLEHTAQVAIVGAAT
jgi:uncharacterized protein (UPF0333 family)